MIHAECTVPRPSGAWSGLPRAKRHKESALSRDNSPRAISAVRSARRAGCGSGRRTKNGAEAPPGCRCGRWDVQMPNIAICLSQAIGRSAVRREVAVSEAGWVPARIASTRAGARKFNRTSLDTQESLTCSSRAMVAMSIVPVWSCCHQARPLRSNSMSPASGLPAVTALPSRWIKRTARPVRVRRTGTARRIGPGAAASALMPRASHSALAEVVVEGCAYRREFLECLHPTESLHCPLSSSELPAPILDPIFEPATQFAAIGISRLTHCSGAGLKSVRCDLLGPTMPLQRPLQEGQRRGTRAAPQNWRMVLGLGGGSVSPVATCLRLAQTMHLV